MQLTSAFLGTQFKSQMVRAQPQQSQSAPRQVTCMAKKKGTRLIITLECTEARAEGATPSRYVTQKSKKNTPGRLEIMKYNKYLRRYTLHKEIK